MANTSKVDDDGQVDGLRRRYCPPLEEALFYAISGDFDLSQPSSRDELVGILDGLKEQAFIEQDLELVPDITASDNGEHGNDDNKNNDNNHESHTQTYGDIGRLAASASSVPPKTDTATTPSRTENGETSVTTGLSDLRLMDDGMTASDSPSVAAALFELGTEGEDLVNASCERKGLWLQTVFPTVKRETVGEVLAKNEGDLHRCTDELLNLSFITADLGDVGDQKIHVARGVEGFAAADDGDDSSIGHYRSNARPRKKKGKNKRHRRDGSRIESYDHSDSASSLGSVTPAASTTTNIWHAASEDVEFIAARTHLPPAYIKSVYHENSASLSATIRALAVVTKEAAHPTLPTNTSGSVSVVGEDEATQLQMEELRVYFEHLSDDLLYSILLLAGQIPSAAKDLVDAMLRRPSDHNDHVRPGRAKLIGVAQYTPINLSSDDDESSTSRRKARATGGINASMYADPSTLAGRAGVHGSAANQAFNQATAAYRRGKSDHLYGGAAAYYASVGHERLKMAKQMQASAADAWVAQQSFGRDGGNVLDLHGVSVEHAVRITRAGVESWWEGLGERKYAVGGRGEGLRIVTGVGTHSREGIGRIGPAVSKMLMREGWSVNIQRGEVIVEGRSRQR